MCFIGLLGQIYFTFFSLYPTDNTGCNQCRNQDFLKGAEKRPCVHYLENCIVITLYQKPLKCSPRGSGEEM